NCDSDLRERRLRRSYNVKSKETATGDFSPVIRLFKAVVVRHPFEMNATKKQARGVKTVGFFFWSMWTVLKLNA
ncbi:hypothetical protein ACV2ER_17580, partial [Salmonella enterica subsp. enterica serovar Pomona]